AARLADGPGLPGRAPGAGRRPGALQQGPRLCEVGAIRRRPRPGGLGRTFVTKKKDKKKAKKRGRESFTHRSKDSRPLFAFQSVRRYFFSRVPAISKSRFSPPISTAPFPVSLSPSTLNLYWMVIFISFSSRSAENVSSPPLNATSLSFAS